MLLDRGDEIIDVRIPNRTLTEEEFKEYNITSNVPAGFWDVDVLEEHFADIDLESLGLMVGDLDFIDALIPEEFKDEEEKDFDPEPRRKRSLRQEIFMSFEAQRKSLPTA